MQQLVSKEPCSSHTGGTWILSSREQEKHLLSGTVSINLLLLGISNAIKTVAVSINWALLGLLCSSVMPAKLAGVNRGSTTRTLEVKDRMF